MLRDLNGIVIIAALDSPAQNEKAVVQKMRIDLRLKLLELRPLRQTGLYINLIDQLYDPLLHPVEAIVELSEFILPFMPDIHGPVPGFQIGKCLQKNPDRTVYRLLI